MWWCGCVFVAFSEKASFRAQFSSNCAMIRQYDACCFWPLLPIPFVSPPLYRRNVRRRRRWWWDTKKKHETGQPYKTERAESTHARAEELEVEVDKLKRRCRSAEQEVDAQKELIDVSEREKTEGAKEEK